MNIKALSDHWTWGLVSGLAAIVALFGFSGVMDLLRDQPFGSTVLHNLRNPGDMDLFPLIFSGVALVMFTAKVVVDFRNRRNKTDR